MADSVQERLKLQRITLDTWSTREKLYLAAAVLRSGDQNWSCVSRIIKPFAEPNRPPDWFSQRNCAQQYASLLETVHTPKRKKRIAGSTERSEGETPGECILRRLKEQRVAELRAQMAEDRAAYLRLIEEGMALSRGEADDKIPYYLHQLDEREACKEREKEEHARWLRDREQRRLELQRAWKPGTALSVLRRESSLSEPSSEADSPLAEPLALDLPDDPPAPLAPPVRLVPAPPPTSPLLTSLLKSPAPPAASAPSSILHSVMTSPLRGASPTIASLLTASPAAMSGGAVGVSANLKSLVTNALTLPLPSPVPSPFDEQLSVPSRAPTPSQGAPTLSMLLELPPSTPGTPLPVLQALPPPAAPPPYSERLGPPPPYSLATEYLQKQRAEQAQAQLAIQNVEKELLQPTLDLPARKTHLPNLDDIEEVIGVDTSLRLYTSDLDHDYSEVQPQLQPAPPVHAPSAEPPRLQPTPTPLPEPEPEPLPEPEPHLNPEQEPDPEPEHDDAKPEKRKLDVFEFGEEDDQDAKLSYLKSNAQRLAKKEAVRHPHHASPSKAQAHEELLSEPDQSLLEEAEEEVKEEPTEDGLAESSETDPVPVPEPVIEPKLEMTEETPALVQEAEAIQVDQEERPGAAETPDPALSAEEGEVVLEVAEPESVEPSKVCSLERAESVEADAAPGDGDDEKGSEGAAVAAPVRRRRGTASLSAAESVPSPVSLTDEEREYKSWKKSVQMVLMRIEGHKSASLFLKPITDDHAPDYSTIMLRPMDLTTIKRNLDAGTIRNTAELHRDLLLMFYNAHLYNKTFDVIYRQAELMQADSLEHFQVLHELRGAGQSQPSRRETRTHDKGAQPRASRSTTKLGAHLKRKRDSLSTGSEGTRKKIQLEES